MIGILNQALDSVIRVFFYPIRALNPWVGMTVVSLATSSMLLLVFRYLSNQQEIRRVKDRIKAHLLEMLLYRDDLRASLRAQGRILSCNLRYLSCTLKPLLVMSVPVLLVLIHLEFWFGYQPLKPGEAAILKVKLAGGMQPSRTRLALQHSSGIDVETDPLRIDAEREVDWRLRAKEDGRQKIKLETGGETIEKEVAVGGTSLSRVSPARVRSSWRDELLNPGEPMIPASSFIERIEISYPRSGMAFLFGWRPHWLLVYFTLTIIFALVLKPLLKIEF